MLAAWQLPTAFPDLDWLYRWMHSDVMVLHTGAVFNRKSSVHRGKIRQPIGTQWIYMPVHPEDRRLPLHACRTDQTTDWVTPLLRSLEFNYRNSPYFDHYEPEIHDDFHQAAAMPSWLDAVNHLNNRLWQYLELPSLPPIHTVQDNDISQFISGYHHSTIRIIPEHNSKNYLDTCGLNIHISTVNISDFTRYDQHFGGFEAGCCLYDVLFQTGPDFWRIYDILQENSLT